jgi:hypothetical protein
MLQAKHFCLLICLSISVFIHGQSWQPALAGLYQNQNWYEIKFKNNLLGKDWIYGTWLDEDSVRRCVAYREGGKWVSLPISFSYGSFAKDIAVYGDTLLIGGNFNQPQSDIDTTQKFYGSAILKWNIDSLWSESRFISLSKFSIAGDSILTWGNYADSSMVIAQHVLSKDGGKTWQYPYSVIHPTESWGDFGAFADLQIHQGQIYTLNNGSSGSDSTGWKGIVRWDGTQWQPYPYGLWGGFARANCFEFYQGDMYMGGSFSVASHPNNPGTGIAKWDGTQWTNMGGGVGNFVEDMFVHNNLLFSKLGGPGYFADAPISYFAAWDGHKWCGTPGNFARPPISFGFANDTLFCTFNEQSTTIGTDTVTHMNYFVGDYVNGPNSVCSTYNLGSPEPYSATSLGFYPNPTSGVFTLIMHNAPLTALHVYDVNGRLLVSQEYPSNTHEITLDIGYLPSGLYVVKAISGQTILTDKLIIMH